MKAVLRESKLMVIRPCEECEDKHKKAVGDLSTCRVCNLEYQPDPVKKE